MRSLSLVTPLSAVSTFFLVASLVSSTSTVGTPTEQSEAQLLDPTEECTAYTYAPLQDAINQGLLPAIWDLATIISNDTEAIALYNSTQGQIPDIPPKGTQPQSLNGDFSDYNYSSTDPDCWWTYDLCTTPKIAGLPDDIVSMPEPDTLGFGFDDGPNCTHNAFYNYLLQNNQKATMFYIGSNVGDWPLQAQRAIDDGHQICVHTWSHNYMTALTNEQAFAELYYAMKIIKLVTGVTPKCWRPPYGDVDDRIRAIANALNLSTIVWSYDSNDWNYGTDNYTAADVDANYDSLIQLAQNGTFSTEGTIFLTHELNNFTMSEMMKYYDNLKSAFKYMVPVAVGYNETNPYVETNYTMPTFAEYISGITMINGSTSATGTQPTTSAVAVSASSTPEGENKSGSQKLQGTSLGNLLLTVGFVGGLLRLLM